MEKQTNMTRIFLLAVWLLAVTAAHAQIPEGARPCSGCNGQRYYTTTQKVLRPIVRAHKGGDMYGRDVVSRSYTGKPLVEELVHHSHVCPVCNGWGYVYGAVSHSSGGKQYFPNGKLKSIGNFIGGKKTGKWQYYYENGKLRTRGEYVSGKEHGVWELFWENGNLWEVSTYTHGAKTGTWHQYAAQGWLTTTIHYANDRPHGEKKVFRENGQLHSTVNYVEGKMEGDEKYYRESGSLSMIMTYSKGKKIRVESYRETGVPEHITHYDGEKKHGDYQRFAHNGQVITEGQYRDNKAYGEWKEYNEDGTLKSTSIKNPMPGTLVKKESAPQLKQVLDAQGQLIAEGFETNGQKTGEWKEFYPDGQIKSTGSYVVVDPKGSSWNNGEWKEFYPDGKVKITGNYVIGKKTGLWHSYYGSGKLRRVINHDYDQKQYLAEEKEYFENTKLKATGLLKHDRREGEWNLFRESGELSATINYSFGKYKGEKKTFHPNGQLKSIGHLAEGLSEVKIDEWKYYHENGKLQKIVLYSTGRVMKTEEYDENGNLIPK